VVYAAISDKELHVGQAVRSGPERYIHHRGSAERESAQIGHIHPGGSGAGFANHGVDEDPPGAGPDEAQDGGGLPGQRPGRLPEGRELL